MVGPVQTVVDRLRHFAVSDPFAQVIKLEQTATRVLQVQPWHVPGVLQLPAYAAATLSIITGQPQTSPEVEERLRLRMARAEAFRQRLESAEPPALSVVIDEAALRQPSVAVAVLHEQLDALLEIMRRFPTVQVAAQSLSAAGYTDARAVEVFERGDGAIEAVFFESARSNELSTDAETGEKYRDLVTSLVSGAIAEEKPSARIERIRDSL